MNPFKLHILLVTHFFLPLFSAGTENYTLSLARFLQSQGHEVDILCAEDWNRGENYWNGLTEDIYEGILVHRIHLNWLKASNPNKVLYDSEPVETWFDQFLSTNKFDIVHVTSAYSLGVGVLRSVKRADIPLILSLMDFWFVCPSIQLLRSDNTLCDGKTTAWQCQACLMSQSNLFQRVEKRAYINPIKPQLWGTMARVPLLNKQRGMRGMLLNMEERKRVLNQAILLPDVLISHSAFVKDRFTQLVSKPVELIRNGYDSTRSGLFQRKNLNVAIRIGYIGQIIPVKGVHVLVEAFQKSGLDGKAYLDIWGDQAKNTSYTEELNQLINSNQSIKLRGLFDRNRMTDVLSGIDVLVVPSLWYENSPLVIQEAFAARIPVIATRLGGMSELVNDEVNGLLFERGDSDDLARQLQRIANEPDIVQRLRDGIPILRTVEEEASDLVAIYNGLIEKNGTKQFTT